MGGCFQPGKPQGEFGHKVSMSTQTSYIPGEPFTQRCKIGMSPLPTAVIVAGFHVYIYIYVSAILGLYTRIYIKSHLYNLLYMFINVITFLWEI